MKEKIKFQNNESYVQHGISSSSTNLRFTLHDVDKNALETMLKDPENTGIIKFIQVNEETQEETVIRAYSGYVNLSSMVTEYDVVTDIDYETEDHTTESGFAEERHDVTTFIMQKPTHEESEIAAMRSALELQNGALEEMATVVSDVADVNDVQDSAIADLGEAVSEISQ